MVKKTRVKTVKSNKKQAKHVTLRPHHAKPYRKRHLGLVLLSLTAVITVIILVFQYRDQVLAGVTSSRNFISDLFQPTTLDTTTVESTNGFSLLIDQRQVYAVGTDGHTGTLYDGDSLSQKRAYTKLQIATTATKFQDTQSALTIAYYPNEKKLVTGDELSNLALKSAGIDRKNLIFVETRQVTLGGKTFEQSIWTTKQLSGPVKKLQASFSTYSTNLNGYPFTITVSEGLTNEPGVHPQFDSILQSLRFDGAVAVNSDKKVTVAAPMSPSLLDVIMRANIASAATKTHAVNDSEKIAALYSPAVAKVYNAYCMDIEVDGVDYAGNYCNAGTGSGFFVSKDGYYATNGHVASVTPKDAAIKFAYTVLALTGRMEYVQFLTQLSNAKESDFASITDSSEVLDKLFDTFYAIDDSKFKKKNDVQNMFVVLGTKQPNADEIIEATAARKKVALDSTWKEASLVASDYRSIDGLKTFHASDVAILKLDGSNFPVATLGSIGDVTQGANLSILGFPGSANNSNLVDSKTTTATLTTGKVSSKKGESGGQKQLIETDTTIGKGNSGGPAFSDEGKVVGIATYTSDGSGQGGGVFNYIRDIKDLQDLAVKKSITFAADSETQIEWETGMGYFYESRYSKALKNFEKVKELYPNHNKVAEFIATSEKRIANGEDVVDFPIVPVVIVSTIAVIGLGIGVFLIVRHRKHHAIYKAGVAQGSVAPGVHQTVAVATEPAVAPTAPGVAVQLPVPAPPVPVQAQTPVRPEDVTPQSPTTNQVPVVMAEPKSVAVNKAPAAVSQSAEISQVAVRVEQPVEQTSSQEARLTSQDSVEFNPRQPQPFSVPTRTDAAPTVSRPIVPPANRQNM